MRNATMSGMTVGTVIVEASVTSGTRIQARYALEQGRPVLILASVLEQGWARDLASRPGVHIIRSPGEITDVLERVRGRGAGTAGGRVAA
jgi:DNA processing protein